jgi:hypothetical protein
MQGLLHTIESTAFSDWVLTSTYGYPILLTLHSIGLAVLVGVLVLIDLRVLGAAAAIPLAQMRRLMTLVWAAFAVNAVSGTALFVSDATRYYYSPTFRWKLLSIVVGVALAAVLSSFVVGAANSPGRAHDTIPLYAKVLAAVSVIVWMAAIGVGRYMAYE